jgi:signal transduction histidine kinase
MLVPLVAHGRALGVLTFVSAESGRRYEPADLVLAEELAGRCALAIDHARLYQAEQQARQAAEAANHAKDEFLSVLSHELRTPLTPILGFTALLRRRQTVDPTMLAGALEVIERSATTQARLVNDLLDVSRIITGKL